MYVCLCDCLPFGSLCAKRTPDSGRGRAVGSCEPTDMDSGNQILVFGKARRSSCGAVSLDPKCTTSEAHKNQLKYKIWICNLKFKVINIYKQPLKGINV